MIKIAICDDEANIRAYLTSLIRAQSCPCEIVEYASAGDCLADYREIDLLFLDIELAPDRPDSMALARKIRKQSSGPQPVIIFVTGYACSETEQLRPLPVVLAHRLTAQLTEVRIQGTIPGLGPDGEAQVSVEYQDGAPKRIATVVVSCQHDADKDLAQLRHEVMRYVVVPAMVELPLGPQTQVLINPSGRFVLGGFEADTGLTGRKLMVDTYGGLVPHGGRALSGKDATKVDRSGTYMARYHRGRHCDHLYPRNPHPHYRLMSTESDGAHHAPPPVGLYKRDL